jgi:hypothetical protein
MQIHIDVLIMLRQINFNPSFYLISTLILLVSDFEIGSPGFRSVENLVGIALREADKLTTDNVQLTF